MLKLTKFGRRWWSVAVEPSVDHVADRRRRCPCPCRLLVMRLAVRVSVGQSPRRLFTCRYGMWPSCLAVVCPLLAALDCSLSSCSVARARKCVHPTVVQQQQQSATMTRVWSVACAQQRTVLKKKCLARALLSLKLGALTNYHTVWTKECVPSDQIREY